MSRRHTFYLAQAHVMAIPGPDTYKLWLPDFKDADLRDRWFAGTLDPGGECITVRRNWVLAASPEDDRTGPNGEVHFLEGRVRGVAFTALPRRLPFPGGPNADRENRIFGQVAIHESLWNQIPVDKRPSPPFEDQDYRLGVVVRTDGNGRRQPFIGYHVEVLDVAPTGTKIRFYNWLGGVVRNPNSDTVAEPRITPAQWRQWFLPPQREAAEADDMGAASEVMGFARSRPRSSSTGESRTAVAHLALTGESPPGTEGAIFIDVDAFMDLPFLPFPKVPFGTGE